MEKLTEKHWDLLIENIGDQGVSFEDMKRTLLKYEIPEDSFLNLLEKGILSYKDKIVRWVNGEDK